MNEMLIEIRLISVDTFLHIRDSAWAVLHQPRRKFSVQMFREI